MQRRTFVGSVFAALAAPLLPAADLGVKVPDPRVWNTATLTAELQKLFVCQPGPAAAMFDMTATGAIKEVVLTESPDAVYPNIAIKKSSPRAEGDVRYVYETYACGVEGGTAEEAEARLAKHFYDQFSQLPTGPLVWRTAPVFATEEVVEYGKTWLTAEQIEDEVWKWVKRPRPSNPAVLSTAYIKDKPLVVPEGVELDTSSGSYKHVVKRTQLHKMRMRLVLPHLYDDENTALPQAFKPEGTPTQRIL
jgi:hypothetical protein